MVSRLMPSCVMISSWLPRQKHIMSPPQLSHFPSDLLPSSSPSSYLPPPVDTSGLFHFCPCFWSLSESPPSPHHITPHIFVPRAISLAPPACLSPPNLFAFTAAQLVDLPSPLHPCPCSPSQGLSPFSPLSLLVLPCWACPLTTCCPTQSYHHLPPPLIIILCSPDVFCLLFFSRPLSQWQLLLFWRGRVQLAVNNRPWSLLEKTPVANQGYQTELPVIRWFTHISHDFFTVMAKWLSALFCSLSKVCQQQHLN